MDKNIIDLVAYCCYHNFNELNDIMVYKYVLNKFDEIELEFEVDDMYEMLFRDKQYLENYALLERRYKKRKLKPIQFAKEKEMKLVNRLKKHLEYLKKAQADKNKEKQTSTKIEIEEIKNLLKAQKERIKRIKAEK